MYKKIFFILHLLASPFIAQALSDPSNIEQRAGITEHLGEFIDPELEFTDETGRKLKFKDLYTLEKPIVIAPVYFECPRLCNFTQAGLLKTINKVRSTLNSDYVVLSVSFNSKEKFELAAKRAEKYREQIESKEETVKKGWKFLVGEEAEIHKLLNQIGFRYEFDQGEYMHAAGLIFLSPEGKIVRYLYGIEFQPRDFDLAISEAGVGKIGSVVRQALIFCFRYDHIKGQYTLAIWSIIRLVSIVFLIIIIAYLIGLRIKEKRSSSTL